HPPHPDQVARTPAARKETLVFPSHSVLPSHVASPRALRRLSCFLTIIGALLIPATASAANLNATPSTFASTFASAQGGDTIYLASGNYGTFTGGSKSSTVTITPASGATATMSVAFNPSDHIRLDGLTVAVANLGGSTPDLTSA